MLEQAADPMLSVVIRLRDAMNEHDLEALVDVFDPDFVSETPAHPQRTFRGADQVRRNWEQIFAGVPDLQADLLDATVPRDNDGRMLLERDIFGRSALNVIACEGADRVERPETYKQWQARNRRAGLTQLPLNPEVVRLVLDKVKDNYHRDFVVDGDQRWLLHRWKGRVLYALSTWIADDAT
jgi:hypothetical protein